MSTDLLPDAVMGRLKTRWLGRPYLYEEEADSTNTRVNELAQQGATHGTLMVADRQTNGRGRLKRSWHSPPGVNLYFSVLLRPGWHAGTTPPVSLAAGVALAEAVESFLPQAPELKWPNDLVFQGRKLAGILVEADIAQNAVQHVVLGIGLNVNVERFPAPLEEIGGSLRMATGGSFHRADVLVAVLAQLELWLDRLQRDGTESVIESWTRYAPWMGKRIIVRSGGDELEGTAVGLEPQGALRLLDNQGRIHSVLSGDVATLIVN